MLRYLAGFLLGLVVTVVLALVLLLGVSSRSDQPLERGYGAVRLSSLPPQQEPIEEGYSTHEAPALEPLEALESIRVELDIPALETSAISVDIDFTLPLAGTVPLSGLPAAEPAGSLTAPSGGALSLGEVDELPRPIYAPAPRYPSGEKRRGIEMKVLVRIVIGRDGRVLSAEPLNKSVKAEAFHAAAVRAVKRWTFSPCKKGGAPVSCVADQPFTFGLD